MTEQMDYEQATNEFAGCPVDKDRGGVIHTYTGGFFYPLDPRPEDIRIEDIAQSLSRLCRFNGHIEAPFYSVAQHSVLCTLLVPAPDAMWALLHDASEAYVGDVVRPLKKMVPQFQEIEKNIQLAIAKRFNLPAEMPESVKMADQIMLATEKRDLLPNSGYWGELVEPANWNIPPYPSDVAYKQFMWAYDNISELRKKNVGQQREFKGDA